MARREAPAPLVDFIEEPDVPELLETQVERRAAEVDDQSFLVLGQVAIERGCGGHREHVLAAFEVAVGLQSIGREQDAALALVVLVDRHRHDDARAREHRIARIVVKAQRVLDATEAHARVRSRPVQEPVIGQAEVEAHALVVGCTRLADVRLGRQQQVGIDLHGAIDPDLVVVVAAVGAVAEEVVAFAHDVALRGEAVHLVVERSRRSARDQKHRGDGGAGEVSHPPALA